jgi:hypothetical protein
MSSHNKKRNTGLLYEFLIRTISEALVENDKHTSSKALKIIKNSFKPTTELYKEFRLINSIMKTTVSSEAVASSILNEAKSAARTHDVNELDRQKSLLIRSINHQLRNENFYDQHIFEYKTYATLQNLFNNWRNPTSDLSKTAEYEDQIVKWLVTPKVESTDQIINENSTGTNHLLMKVMMKKLSEKYDVALTNEQKNLVKAYAFSTVNENNNTIKLKLNEIKNKLLISIEEYTLQNPDSQYMKEKMTEVKSKLNNEITEVNDGVVSEYMLYSKLIEELVVGGENV